MELGSRKKIELLCMYRCEPGVNTPVSRGTRDSRQLGRNEVSRLSEPVTTPAWHARRRRCPKITDHGRFL